MWSHTIANHTGTQASMGLAESLGFIYLLTYLRETRTHAPTMHIRALGEGGGRSGWRGRESQADSLLSAEPCHRARARDPEAMT